MASISKNVRVGVVNTDKEWFQVRESLVRAFYNYPLYTYLLRNEATREEFLRQYIEAVYDVVARHGNSIVLSIKIFDTAGKSVADNPCSRDFDTIIGGVMFVPPDKEGGWDCPDDDIFFESYREHGLHEIDSEGYEDIIKYEIWESEHVLSKVADMNLRAWDVFFWGIDPKYSSVGYGSASYDDIIEVLNDIKRRKYSDCRNGDGKSSTLPVVMTLSHCHRAANFHVKHGFETISMMPICHESLVQNTDEETRPYVRVMLFNAPNNANLKKTSI